MRNLGPMDSILLCVGIDEPHVDGSIPGTCSICGNPVWISPGGIGSFSEVPGLKVACVPCGLAVTDQADDPEFMTTESVMRNLELAEGPSARRDVESMLGNLNREARRRLARRRRS